MLSAPPAALSPNMFELSTRTLPAGVFGGQAGRMRSLGWLFTLVAVASLCAGCANESLASEADELRAEVAGLPGVTSAKLDYSEPITLDSGKVVLKVEMDDTATPDEVVAVTETAYRAFSSTHQDEEADLSVRAGQTTVALRSFEPEASVTAVSDAARAGLMARPDGGSVAIDLTTDGVPKGDHVAGTYIVALPEGSTFAEVPDLLASLGVDQSENAQIGWGGAAADGSSLSYDRGFPPDQLVGRWERMQRAEVPLAVRAFHDGVVIAEGRVTARYDVKDAADRRSLDRLTHPQLHALAEGDGEWAYTLIGADGAFLADIDRFVCVPSPGGPYDDQLEAWATEQFGPCEAS